MTAGVFDFPSIKASQKRLEPSTGPWIDRDHFGNLAQHCDVCPTPDGEACTLNCNAEWEKLKDGIKVSCA